MAFIFVLEELVFIWSISLFSSSNGDKNFTLVQSSNGTFLCSLDKPTAVYVDPIIQTPACVPEETMCAWRCQMDPSCSSFNFKRDLDRCEIYDFTTTSYATISNCTHFAQILNRLPSCPIVAPGMPPENCTFPFTNGGGLYYSCKQSTTSPCTTGCYNSNRNWTNCQQPNNYLAKYITINFTIPIRNISKSVLSINNWITFQQRIDGTVSFSMLWNDYVNGFGNLINVWLGLENVYQITRSRAYKLRIEVQATSNGKWFSAEYSSFYLDSSSNFYAIHVSGYSGDAGDAFNIVTGPASGLTNGAKFSTTDSVNDNSGFNTPCVTIVGGGGWWMNYCCYMDLNSPYGSTYFYWHSLTDLGMATAYQVKTSRMMIKAL